MPRGGGGGGILEKGADSLDFGKPSLFSYVARKLSFFMKTVRNFDMMKKT